MVKKLIVLGSINADHVLNLPQFPKPGQTLTGNHYHIAFGGKGANQAVAAGRGGANIQFIAAVGDDDIGKTICEQLIKDQIDTRSIASIANEKTGVALIFVNQQGENEIGIYAGANAAVTPDYLHAYQQDIIDADAILMQLETPLATIASAVKLAKQHHTQVIVNPAPAQALTDEILSHIDIITPNETEAESLTGITVSCEQDADRAAKQLHQKGINTVIITLGSKGAWVSVAGVGKLIAGYQVQAVDTIAAGDTFNGMLVTALLEGKTLDEAVKYAHAAAAIAVTRTGAQSSVPWREEIEQFMVQHR
ncbi:ribokinase [Orbus hercynius]|uniref:Ribokinase n=1 Tax=Orbus hercynius TaxID=593135 RepID=A0A495RJA3_9GAMM|nr:ribokinase [Orbus hercynius]RKS87622.1 ribokinase [Orbus hercynius]